MYVTIPERKIPQLYFWKLTGEDGEYSIEFDQYGLWPDLFSGEYPKQPYLCDKAISELRGLLQDVGGTGCMIIDDDYEGIVVIRHNMKPEPEISVVIIDASNITDINFFSVRVPRREWSGVVPTRLFRQISGRRRPAATIRTTSRV